jgi:hypothetical protein
MVLLLNGITLIFHSVMHRVKVLAMTPMDVTSAIARRMTVEEAVDAVEMAAIAHLHVVVEALVHITWPSSSLHLHKNET